MVDLIELHLPASIEASLSGLAASPDGAWLWLAPDEGRSLIRLQRETPGYGNAQLVDLDKAFPNLPHGKELDLEGLDILGNELWFTGSHSRVRKQVEKDATDVDDILHRLKSVKSQPSRQVLGRLDAGTDPDGNVVGPNGRHAFLGPDASHPLVAELAEDDWLGPFAGIPGKDNGLDIEGLAWCGDTLLLGLRGPVLRGWAVLVAIHPEQADHHEHCLDLGEAFGDHRYQLLFADLGGLGVRDLCRDGKDLLILAGPTMVLDEPFRIHRLTDAATRLSSRALPAGEVPVDKHLTYELLANAGTAHPEGITVLPDGDHRRLIVIDDNARPDANGNLLCRTFPLPGKP